VPGTDRGRRHTGWLSHNQLVPSAPADEYRHRLDTRRAEHLRWTRRHEQLATARLVTFLGAALITILAVNGAATYWLLALPAVVFGALLRQHDRVLRRRDSAAAAIAFYERGLARIEDRWAGSGDSGHRFLDEDHLYAHDLDLFGDGSLFQLLSVARTRDGEAMLAGWLLAPAERGEIPARQAAVAELGAAVDLREQLAVVGQGPLTIDTGVVVAWAEATPHPVLKPLRALAFLSAAAVLLTTGYLVVTGDIIPVLTVLILEALLFRGARQRMEQELHLAGGRARDLDAVSALVELVQSASFRSPKLAGLSLALRQHGVDAASAIRRLHRLSEFHDWEHSLPLFPVGLFLAGFVTGTAAYIGAAIALGAAIVLWSPFLTVATEAWRRMHGHRVRAWIDVVATVEGLASFAAYHFEHPADPFPTVVAPETARETSRAAGCFDGRELGHPLLTEARMVRNDVRLTAARQLLVISGSNMSGKSTLLRTVGTNTVLALAGAPVRAASLTLSPLAVGATLRIQDSLLEGRSRFYAEITRIRQLADHATGPIPLLFLLDELFHGTNSHDRLVGASGVLRGLLDRGAIGLITTHDLALTAIADQLGPRAANVHFEDWFEGGDLRFDYKMKAGPVTRSNALALMRAVGLKVDP
jgi:hypothetical protein